MSNLVVRIVVFWGLTMISSSLLALPYLSID